MHIAIWKILTDVLKGVGARFFSQLREIMRRDSREIPAPVGRPKKPRLAGTLSIIPGVGQLYLGQTAKGLLMLVTSYPGFPLFVITIPLGVLDAYILGLRLARRPIRRWECFWNREPPEVWTVAEVRQLGRMEEPIGTETRVIDNSDSPIGCT